MTALILQARLDSSRLPGKALLDFLGEPMLFRVMERLIAVPADAHVLACDYDSFEQLAPLAKRAGFKCIAGPKDDVLARFCAVISEVGCDVVLRATGDNPFLFTEAAALTLARFAHLQKAIAADYFTFTGLPHGSGVEAFAAASLLKAQKGATSAFEREHVGPALYLHPNEFNCVFEAAPAEWASPRLRTTVDTSSDYATALAAADFLLKKGKRFPFADACAKAAFEYVTRAVVFVPACAPSRGTGHLRRTFAAALALRDEWNCFILIEGFNRNEELAARVMGLLSSYNIEDSRYIEERIIATKDFAEAFEPLNVEVSRFVLDNFETSKAEILELLQTAPVIAVDEGGEARAYADYVFDVIPSLLHAPGRAKKKADSFAGYNLFKSECIPLPKATTRRGALDMSSRVLVAAGGLTPAACAEPIAYAQGFAAAGFDTTLIIPQSAECAAAPNLEVSRGIPRLAERLGEFDAVIAYYGFTAFEALAAGCRVALFAPSQLHKETAAAYGFALVPPPAALQDAEAAKRFIFSLNDADLPVGACASFASHERAQADYAKELSLALAGRAFDCAFCGHEFFRNENAPSAAEAGQVWRDSRKTIVLCPKCGTPVIRYSAAPKKAYGESYFFEEYARQYGKTYLEDFALIKKSGERRIKLIDEVAAKSLSAKNGGERTVLDVGCAYGPFLAAAQDAGWRPYGADVSDAAVQYVKDALGIPAVKAAFPEYAAAFKEGGFPAQFDAVSFWFVIEHFENLPAVLDAVRKLLVPGGVLAISTPSCDGISARKDKAAFFAASPDDHYSVWNPRKIRRQLKKSGFSVKKIVATGHHAERFPQSRVPRPLKKAYLALCSLVSFLFSLGDTFEVYAVKNEQKETEAK